MHGKEKPTDGRTWNLWNQFVSTEVQETVEGNEVGEASSNYVESLDGTREYLLATRKFCFTVILLKLVHPSKSVKITTHNLVDQTPRF